MHDLTDDIAKTLNVPMVTRWMLVAEVIDGDGDTQIQPGWTIDYGGPAYEGGEDD